MKICYFYFALLKIRCGHYQSAISNLFSFFLVVTSSVLNLKQSLRLNKLSDNLLCGKLDYSPPLCLPLFIISYLFFYSTVFVGVGRARSQELHQIPPPSINLRAAVRRRFHLRDMKRFVALWDY